MLARLPSSVLAVSLAVAACAPESGGSGEGGPPPHDGPALDVRRVLLTGWYADEGASSVVYDFSRGAIDGGSVEIVRWRREGDGWVQEDVATLPFAWEGDVLRIGEGEAAERWTIGGFQPAVLLVRSSVAGERAFVACEAGGWPPIVFFATHGCTGF